MSRGRFKTIVALVALVGLALLGLTLAHGLARLSLYFQQAAEPVSPLNVIPDVPVETAFDLRWLPDDADTGRQMEPYTRRQIESAYVRAWLQLNLSYARQEPHGLRSYFVGPALAAVTANVSALAAQGWQLSQTNQGHRLQLHFYSADGSIVSFTDQHAVLDLSLSDAAGAPVLSGQVIGVYDVVMFLEDGNWRVRHWLKVGESTGP